MALARVVVPLHGELRHKRPDRSCNDAWREDVAVVQIDDDDFIEIGVFDVPSS